MRDRAFSRCWHVRSRVQLPGQWAVPEWELREWLRVEASESYSVEKRIFWSVLGEDSRVESQEEIWGWDVRGDSVVGYQGAILGMSVGSEFIPRFVQNDHYLWTFLNYTCPLIKLTSLCPKCRILCRCANWITNAVCDTYASIIYNSRRTCLRHWCWRPDARLNALTRSRTHCPYTVPDALHYWTEAEILITWWSVSRPSCCRIHWAIERISSEIFHIRFGMNRKGWASRTRLDIYDLGISYR